jgi:hypothetical protein
MFNFFRAKKTDPITSHEAADSTEIFASQHFKLIHNALMQYGPLGKDGISYFTLLNPNAISRRLPEMQKLGMVELTGKTVMSNAKRKEREWKAV